MLRNIASRVINAWPAIKNPHLLWVPVDHYYSPVVPIEDRERVIRDLDFNPPEVEGIELRDDAQRELLDRLLPLASDLPFQERGGECRYSYDNNMYRYTDGVLYAAMLRHLSPRRLIEVGSGYSSALALDVADRYLDPRPTMTFIEPYPDILRSLTRDSDLTGRLVEQGVQSLDLSVFSDLAENDILFIDSTHVSRTGSDVNYLIFEVLPRLAHGVYVHVHDIPWPFEYFPDWIRQGRAWNEAYLLRAFLQYNEAFEIVLFNSYVAMKHREWFAEHLPVCLKDTGGGIWLRRG